jgi:hypothetical protein
MASAVAVYAADAAAPAAAATAVASPAVSATAVAAPTKAASNLAKPAGAKPVVAVKKAAAPAAKPVVKAKAAVADKAKAITASNVIQHVSGPIALDKGMAPFAAVPSFFLSNKNPANVVQGTVKNNADLSMDLRVAEDGKNIYVALEVTKGSGPVNKKDIDNIWNGDCVELYLSSKSDMVKVDRLKKSDWDYQVVMAPTMATGKPVIRAFGTDFTGLQVNATPGPKGYVMTALIPLSNLKDNDWKPGKSVKFDAAVAKAGPSGGREVHLFWHSDIDAYDNPSKWGVADIK